MECVNNCWFKNPDTDFDPNYPSDSESAGLLETDNEFDRNVYNQEYDKNKDNNNSSTGERSSSQILNDNTTQNAQLQSQPFVCDKCPSKDRKVIKLKAMLNQQQNDEKIAKKQLRKKYMEYKGKCKKLLHTHNVDRDYIINYKKELKRQRNKNTNLLKEKHNISNEKDELQKENYNLQLEINELKQKLHDLNRTNEQLLREYNLAEEKHRAERLQLLRKVNSTKQNTIFANKTASASLKNIYENKENIFKDGTGAGSGSGSSDDGAYDDNDRQSVISYNSHSDHDPDEYYDDDDDDDNAHITRISIDKTGISADDDVNVIHDKDKLQPSTPMQLIAASSIGSVGSVGSNNKINLIPIEENKEDSPTRLRSRAGSTGSVASIGSNHSNGSVVSVGSNGSHSDGSRSNSFSQSQSQQNDHSYTNNDLPFIMRARSGSIESSYDYDDDVQNAPFIMRSPSQKHPIMVSIDNPQHNYTNYTNYYKMGSSTGGSHAGSGYFHHSYKYDTNTPDLMRNLSHESPISPLTSLNRKTIDFAQFDDNKSVISTLSMNPSKSNDNFVTDDDGIDNMTDDEDKYQRKLKQIKSKNKYKRQSFTQQMIQLKSQLIDLKNDKDDNKDNDKATATASSSLPQLHNAPGDNSMDTDNITQAIRRNSLPLSGNEPIDLKRTQRINEKMMKVSIQNTALKSKNDKLNKDIKDLQRRLSQISVENDKNGGNLLKSDNKNNKNK